MEIINDTKEIYLDNSSTTKPDNLVLEEMDKYYRKYYGNPSSLHKMGIVAEKGIKEARNQIAKMLNINEKEVYFNSGGTEGNNLAIKGVINKNKRIGKRIITSKIEHPSVSEVMKNLDNNGYDIVYLDVNEKGLVDIEQLIKEMNQETILVSIMKVNNEIGIIQPIKEISRIAKEISSKCIIHSDCVQTAGKIEINPVDEGIDILTISGHKFHGPKGIGAMYINNSLNILPEIIGGGQEKGLRSGTENVPCIVGMGKAAEIAIKEFHTQYEHLLNLKRILCEKLVQKLEGIKINSSYDNGVPHILSVSFKDIKGEVLLHSLEDKGIYVSTGSACSGKKSSSILRNIKLRKEYIDGTIRISLSKYNTVQEIEYTVDTIVKVVNVLRRYIRR